MVENIGDVYLFLWDGARLEPSAEMNLLGMGFASWRKGDGGKKQGYESTGE